MLIEIATTERGLLLAKGRPARYLAPGRHWVLRPFTSLKLERLDVTRLLVHLDDTRLALVPAEDLAVVTVAAHQRALVTQRGKPMLWLGPGVHQVWTVDRLVERATGKRSPLITVELVDTSAVPAPLLSPDVAALAKGRDYVEATAPEGCVVLRYVDGTLDAVLPTGRHAAWTTLKTVSLAVIDLRERLLHVTGQEVMTKDKVSLRLNISATVRVKDPRRLALVAREPDEVAYLALQLAARDAVTSRTLDELLASREALAAALTVPVAARVAAVGLELVELGLKDVVLPGEMKELLNKVTQAQKEAEANVIFRREETAATRSLAQTAKLLQENPLLVRLKELEAYKELAGKVGKVHLVLGEHGLAGLHLKG